MVGLLPPSENLWPVSPGVTPGVVIGVVAFVPNVSRFDVSDGVAVSSAGNAGSLGKTCGSDDLVDKTADCCDLLDIGCAMIALARYRDGSSVMSSE